MADARAGGDTAEPGVRKNGDVLAEIEIAKRGGDLEDFLHTRAERAAANEHHDVAGLDALGAVALDSGDGGGFGAKDAGRAEFTIDAIDIDHARVDRRTLDYRAAGSEVAARKAGRGSKAAFTGAGGIHDDIVRIDAVALAKNAAKLGAAL